MSFQNTSIIHISYSPSAKKMPFGRLAIKDRQIFFEYNPDFLMTKLELSPFKLPLQKGIISSSDRVFEGLFGVFNDSLPDGWGRLLLDRKLLSNGINPNYLTPLDRLCYVGHCGMGALVYEPEIEGAELQIHQDLDEIADETLTFQENEDHFVDELLALNGASAGARPKILVRFINNAFIASGDIVSNNDWIIKFHSMTDPKDAGSIEYAYHLMARAANLDVPEAKLFKSKRQSSYFGVKRFDRHDHNRLHMHTISGLLHADHTIPSLDYETLLRATLRLTKNITQCEKQFRAIVFNLLSHNRDDHSKNFSFLMNEKGLWTVSPAYDLTFSSGPAGEHCTMILGEGKNPSLIHALKLAEIASIKKQTANNIIEEVKNAVSKWQEFSEISGVKKTTISRIQNSLSGVAKNFFSKK